MRRRAEQFRMRADPTASLVYFLGSRYSNLEVECHQPPAQ
jgi:hypothetical protein